MTYLPNQLGLDGPDRILRFPEATRLVGVSRDTLLREAKRGQLRIMRLTARRAGIQLSELRRWLQARKSIHEVDAA
jgi:predicted DNA-binding transcriptional regulator AlpA